MKKLLVLGLAALMSLSVFAFVGCDGGETPPDDGTHTHSYVDGICECGKYEAAFLSMLPMAPDLQATCDQQGTLEEFSYTARAYALEEAEGTGEEIVVEKKAQVYLPYGYDESKEYNILYLMHGGGETYTYWLIDMGMTTRNVLDDMIKDGKCDPVIVVAPTYESPAEGHEGMATGRLISGKNSGTTSSPR